MLLEITITQDSIKFVNERSSTNILDFLGDVGGFQGAISIIGIIGAFFSQTFFFADVGSKLYIQKISKKEIEKEYQANKQNNADQ